jgi:hypothetical protein
MTFPIAATYILPIRRSTADLDAEFTAYLRWLAHQLDVIVVDGSSPEVFVAHAAHWGAYVDHRPVDDDLRTPMGKVGGVLTGVRWARYDSLVIADDDVRYDRAGLERIVAGLHTAHVVRPQNFFAPLPWHARWDTARTLLNRMTGGDWPGTLGVRRAALLATDGYDGTAMFENLELVRTIRAAGGVEAVPLDVFVRRHPPTTQHFWSQRVRQAYDELARPLRFAVWLAILPLATILVAQRCWHSLLAAIAFSIGLAEAGRWRAGGRSVFPLSAALLAPLWIAERTICSWLALGSRLRYGGVRYRGRVLALAATPRSVLRQRFDHHPLRHVDQPQIGTDAGLSLA